MKLNVCSIQSRKKEKKTPKHTSQKPKTKDKTTHTEKNVVPCSGCQQLYEKLQEEKFQRILTNKEAEFWEGLQKSTASDMEKLQNITKISIIQDEQIKQKEKPKKKN